MKKVLNSKFLFFIPLLIIMIISFLDMYRSDKKVKSYNPKDINKKINEIFGSLNHVYKSKVRITMTDGVKEEQIVGKTNTNLLTIDNKLIKITDILDIERI